LHHLVDMHCLTHTQRIYIISIPFPPEELETLSHHHLLLSTYGVLLLNADD